MTLSRIVALDGHDAAGKTTLAHALAERVGGLYQRPFHGSLGTALLRAGERKDFDGLIAIGKEGIETAIKSAKGTLPIVLDRSWMTVASLVEPTRVPAFFEKWEWWMPTALCWANLATTVARLGARDEPKEAVEEHRHYLAVYRSLARHVNTLVVRTDIHSEQTSLELLFKWFTKIQGRRLRLPPL